MNPLNEDYRNTFGPDFKVLLFGGFESLELFYGFNIIEKLYQINQIYKVGIFDCAIKLNEQAENFSLPLIKMNQHFNENFVQL